MRTARGGILADVQACFDCLYDGIDVHRVDPGG